MRLINFLSCTLVLLQPCSSLPFGSRPNKQGEDETAAADTSDDGGAAAAVLQKEKVAIRGAAATVSKELTQELSTNTVVDTFFQSATIADVAGDDNSEISKALQDEIHEVAGAEGMKDFLSQTRRSLHRHPELMYQESFTSDAIQAALTELDIPFTTGWAKNTHPDIYPGPGGYGVVATIGTGSAPCVLLRADMDALPILEATNDIEGFRSTEGGKMHACGHDGHTTMLLGAAAALKKMEGSIGGTVRLMFQPAEEGGAGAKRMVEEGVVTMGPEAQHAFAMHVWPTLPTGTIASRPGPLLAAAVQFEITLSGKGGHAAMPHLTIDPIIAASSLVTNLQTIVSRTISPLESGVVSVTAISAGDAFNVIPAAATLKGTVRALSTDMLLSLRDRVDHMVQSTAELHGCNATVRWSPDYYPPTINDAALFEWSQKVGGLVSHEGFMRDIEPTMGGEDFAFVANAVPSTFFLVGQGTGGDERYHLPRTDYGLHHPSFALDEEVLPIGVELHVNVALRALKKLSQESEETTSSEL